MAVLTARAPAKINLTLHVLRRRVDGLHDLESLVAFAGAGDTLTLTPGEALTLTLDGPTAEAAGAGDDNLVLRAARALGERVGGLASGAFHLAKRLPVAAGMGGGSADAAAALRLLARANGLAPDDPRLLEAARSVGADVPVCLAPRVRMMRGAGDALGPTLRLAPLFAVLVNPGVLLATRDVFAAMAIRPGSETGFGGHPDITSTMGFDALVRALAKSRNDMEDAAILLAPRISDVLAVLSAARGCRLARMSGSGATCFGLFEDCRAAGKAAKAIAQGNADWWVKPTLLR